jgi:hypothetical protein
MLLLLFASYFAPDLSRLGADDWNTREREEARCDHFLSALMLPVRHGDPEVNYRIRALRARNLRWLRADYLERRVFATDFGQWARLYLFTGRSLIARDFDTFAAIHCDNPKALAVFERWSPWSPFNGGGFLTGSIFAGEYETYLNYLDYHLSIAPAPRERP